MRPAAVRKTLCGMLTDMSEVIKEIESAIDLLNLSSSDIVLLDNSTNRSLYYDLLSTFVQNGDRRWWWEDFKTSFNLKDFEFPFDHLNKIIPDLDKNVWLMVEDDQLDFYPIYDVTPTIIKDIISNCFGFEYYIIDKDKSWLLCENHHKRLIGVGDILRQHNVELLDN